MKRKVKASRRLIINLTQSEKKGKTKILDEFCQNTGYNRKYALHLLTNWGKTEVFKPGDQLVRLKEGVRTSGRVSRFSYWVSTATMVTSLSTTTSSTGIIRIEHSELCRF